MAQKRIYELTEDTAPTADHSLALDKSGNAAATRVTLTNLLQKLRVGLQSYGGNARGSNAVDLQITRTADAKVASGSHSVIGGGQSNTASATNTTVSGGSGNTASKSGSTVGGGVSNTASGAAIGTPAATVAGGNSNTASATDSAIGGGYGNAASAQSAWVPGGRHASANKYGQGAHAAGQFAAVGDAQHGWLLARKAIASHSDTTWYDLTLDGSSAQLTIPTDTLWQFAVMVVGLTSGAAQRWAYRIEGAIVNDGGSTSLVGSPSVTVISESDANYDCQAVADDTNDALDIQVRRNGGSDYNVRWVASVEVVEVAFP